jgi:hypothetical protein
MAIILQLECQCYNLGVVPKFCLVRQDRKTCGLPSCIYLHVRGFGSWMTMRYVRGFTTHLQVMQRFRQKSQWDGGIRSNEKEAHTSFCCQRIGNQRGQRGASGVGRLGDIKRMGEIMRVVTEPGDIVGSSSGVQQHSRQPERCTSESKCDIGTRNNLGNFTKQSRCAQRFTNAVVRNLWT